MTTTAPEEGPAPTIRRASEGDLSAIHRIEQASFPQPWPYAAFERYLDEPGFLVAEAPTEAAGADRTAVVGYVIADSLPNHGTPLGHVKDVAVAEDHRGRGIGSTLLGRAIDYLSEAGAETVKLEVRESNEAAIRLYRRFGFAYRRRIEGYYGNGEDALVLVADVE